MHPNQYRWDSQLNHPVTFRVEVRTFRAVPAAQVTITLPPNVKLVSGSLIWQGSVPENSSAWHTVQVQVTKAGEWEVRASGTILDYPGWGEDTDRIYLLSSARTGRASHSKSPNHWYPPATSTSLGGQSANTVAGDLVLIDEPQLNRTLTVRYTAISFIDLPEANLAILLPPQGFQVLSVVCPASFEPVPPGMALVCEGHLPAHVPLTMNVTAAIHDTGQGYIEGAVGYQEHSGTTVYGHSSGYRRIYLEVNRYGGYFESAN